MNKELWNYILARYPTLKNNDFDTSPIYKAINYAYEIGYDEGYGNGHDDGFNYCCTIHKLKPDD